MVRAMHVSNYRSELEAKKVPKVTVQSPKRPIGVIQPSGGADSDPEDNDALESPDSTAVGGKIRKIDKTQEAEDKAAESTDELDSNASDNDDDAVDDDDDKSDVGQDKEGNSSDENEASDKEEEDFDPWVGFDAITAAEGTLKSSLTKQFKLICDTHEELIAKYQAQVKLIAKLRRENKEMLAMQTYHTKLINGQFEFINFLRGLHGLRQCSSLNETAIKKYFAKLPAPASKIFGKLPFLDDMGKKDAAKNKKKVEEGKEDDTNEEESDEN